MKKYLPILLTAVLSVLILTGCQSKESEYAKQADSAMEESRATLREVKALALDMSKTTGLEYEKQRTESVDYDYDGFVAYCAEQREAVETAIGRVNSLSQALERLDTPTDEAGLAAMEKQQEYFDAVLASFREIHDLISFTEQENAVNGALLAAMQTSAADQGEYLINSFNSMMAAWDLFDQLEPPKAVGDIWTHYRKTMAGMEQAMLDQVKVINSSDVLSLYSAMSLIQRSSIVFSNYEGQMVAQEQAAYTHQADLLERYETGPVVLETPEVRLSYSIVDEIMPNLYPSMDSAVNLTVSTNGGEAEILVSAQIEGFTQSYEQKLTVSPEATVYLIKPPVSPTLPDLNSSTDTQIKFSVTDADSGKTLAQESKTIRLESVYDYRIVSDEFGTIENDNILAWLTPDSESILALRRVAVEWLESALGYGGGVLPGYQSCWGFSAGDPNIVYNQVIALQAAISAEGVRYNNGSYSFSDNQRVLTPSAVLQSGSGICIETSILMASALMSTGMHPMIVLTPGHAQVAVETWADSGQYILIETTDLPFSGMTDEAQTLLTPFTNSGWIEYLNEKEAMAAQGGGFVYVIDCDLQKVLEIQGLNY